MKLIFKFLIVAIAISTVQAFAQGFYCSTTPASTSYTLSENSEGNFELLIRHNLGVEHAPLLNGITTGYTLGIVEDRFEYAKKMGQSFQVKFPKDKCRFEEKPCLLQLVKAQPNWRPQSRWLLSHCVQESVCEPFG
jgi:hypothetical protein